MMTKNFKKKRRFATRSSTQKVKKQQKEKQTNYKQRNNNLNGRTVKVAVSNHVPVDTVLRSILDPSHYPYLYLPEYMKRRCYHLLMADRNNANNNTNTIRNGKGKSKHPLKLAPSAQQREQQQSGNTVQLPLPPPKLDRIYQQFLNESKLGRASSHTKRTFVPSDRRRKKKRYRDNSNGGALGYESVTNTAIKGNKKIDEDEKKTLIPLNPGGNSRSVYKNQIDHEEEMTYQLLARIVVVPFSNYLISIVAHPPPHCHTIPTSIIKENFQNKKTIAAATTATTKGSTLEKVVNANKETIRLPSNNDWRESDTFQKQQQVQNRYKQNGKCTSLFQQDESLVSLVDGVISTLVQRREMIRRKLRLGLHKEGEPDRAGITGCNAMAKQKVPRWAFSGNGDGLEGEKSYRDYHCRRRNAKEEYEHMNRVRNVLAEGYSLARPPEMGGSSSEVENFLSPPPSTDNRNTSRTSFMKRKTQNQITTVNHCQNMAPGIHCTHPNTIASYARTSRLVRTMHNILGDDLLRELLLHSIVLVPTGKIIINRNHKYGNGACGNITGVCNGSNTGEEIVDNVVRCVRQPDGGTIERGNYFQLCGPPLNTMKAFGGMNIDALHCHNQDNGFSEERIAGKRQRSGERKFDLSKSSTANIRKRKRQDYARFSVDDADSSISLRYSQNVKSVKALYSPNGIANDSHWIVPRNRLFYSESFVKSIGFPPSHILNRLNSKEKDKSGNSPEEQLLDDIVQIYYSPQKQRGVKSGGKQWKRRKRWKRLRTGGIEICSQLLLGHKKCDYPRLLERYCPIGDLSLTNDKKDAKKVTKNRAEEEESVKDVRNISAGASAIVPSLVSSYCSPDQVKSFVFAVLKRVFPQTFWGSNHNFKVVMTVIDTFLNLRKREQISLKSITHGIRVMDIIWLFHSNDQHNNNDSEILAKRLGRRRKNVPKSSHEIATLLMQSQQRWLYSRFLIPLLRSSFYITDTEFTGKRMLYYRKPVWSRLKALAIDELLKRQYTELRIKQTLTSTSVQKLGFSRLRLLPKKNGIRPIAARISTSPDMVKTATGFDLNSKRIDIIPSTYQRSTNALLKEAFDILKFERNLEPDRFGVGMSGMDEIHSRLVTFLKKIRNSSKFTDKQNLGPLYFASVDIRKCYDNINQTHLYNVVSDVISEDEYLIQKYSVMHPFLGKKSSSRCKKMKSVGAPGNFVTLPGLGNELASRHSSSIMVDDVNCQIIKKEGILALLKEHLSRHVVVAKRRFGPQFLLQEIGIPQGSILSTILCNYYYGDIEKHLLDGVFSNIGKSSHKYLLVRMVDDYLLITPERNVVSSFLDKMVEGIPKFGVHINKAKSRVNHDTELFNSDGTKHCSLKNCCVNQRGVQYFPWCGMLFNTETCAVQVDYSRFAGAKAIDSLTIDRIEHEGIQFERTMKTFVRPRCQNIFFDPIINSAQDIKMNFYLAILFCAIKTVLYFNSIDAANVTFFRKCIEDVIMFAYNSIDRSLRNLEVREIMLDSKVESHLSSWLKKDDAMWLAKHAFKSILIARYRAEYRSVIQKLEKYLSHNIKSNYYSVAAKALELFDQGRF